MRHEAVSVDYHDGTLLPMESIAVCPVRFEDLAELVALVPRDLAGELATMAAWRALGMEVRIPAIFWHTQARAD